MKIKVRFRIFMWFNRILDFFVNKSFQLANSQCHLKSSREGNTNVMVFRMSYLLGYQMFNHYILTEWFKNIKLCLFFRITEQEYYFIILCLRTKVGYLSGRICKCWHKKYFSFSFELILMSNCYNGHNWQYNWNMSKLYFVVLFFGHLKSTLKIQLLRLWNSIK